MTEEGKKSKCPAPNLLVRVEVRAACAAALLCDAYSVLRDASKHPFLGKGWHPGKGQFSTKRP